MRRRKTVVWSFLKLACSFRLDAVLTLGFFQRLTPLGVPYHDEAHEEERQADEDADGDRNHFRFSNASVVVFNVCCAVGRL